jgi:hypothetical protein
MNVTGPDAMTVGEVIFVVKVTSCPRVDGFADELSVAELVACCITWFSTAEVLLALLASPAYTAVRA